MGGRDTPSRTGGGWERERVEEDLSPSCESVPDPEPNDSIGSRHKQQAVYVCVSMYDACVCITLRDSHYN